MANITGLITVNGKDILEVDAVPSGGAGTPANRGSLSMYDDGAIGYLYVKTGTADTAWTLLETPDTTDWKLTGNTLVGTEIFGSLNDEDVKFDRNNIEVMRMVGTTAAVQGLIIGLTASLGGRLQLAPDAAGDDIFKEVLSPTANPFIHVTRMHRLTTVGALTAVAAIAIPTAYNVQVKSRVVARQTGGATGAIGDGASYERTCHAKNLAGTVTMFKEQTDYTYEVAGALDFNLAAAGATIEGTVTGSTGRNITWGVYTDLLMLTT